MMALGPIAFWEAKANRQDMTWHTHAHTVLWSTYKSDTKHILNILIFYFCVHVLVKEQAKSLFDEKITSKTVYGNVRNFKINKNYMN